MDLHEATSVELTCNNLFTNSTDRRTQQHYIIRITDVPNYSSVNRASDSGIAEREMKPKIEI